MSSSGAMPAGPKQWGSANSECPKLFNQTVHPDTFVEIDSHCFKELVQKLTGVSQNSEEKKLPVTRPARNSKKDSPAEGIKSGGNCCALVKSGIQLGVQKSAFKLQDRRKFQRKLEINMGLNDHHNTKRVTGYNSGLPSMTLPALISSPITPLGPADPFNSPSSSYCYDSTPTFCTQSFYLEEEKEKFCFEASTINVKREPELLPLFPLHSSTQSNT